MTALLTLAALLFVFGYAWTLTCDEPYCGKPWAWRLYAQRRPSGVRYRWLCAYHAKHPSKHTQTLFHRP